MADARLVIDVGCGDGTCARYVADGGARRVDGFDLSMAAVREARCGPAKCNVEFFVADARRLPVANASYDMVVSFETIEHIRDDRAYLAEAVRVLKAGGLFLCSTPNRALLNPGTSITWQPMNPFHVREYKRLEFERLLGEFFDSVVVIGQSFYSTRYCRFLRAAGRIVAGAAAHVHQARKCITWPAERLAWHRPASLKQNMEPEILLAICGRNI